MRCQYKLNSFCFDNVLDLAVVSDGSFGIGALVGSIEVNGHESEYLISATENSAYDDVQHFACEFVAPRTYL